MLCIDILQFIASIARVLFTYKTLTYFLVMLLGLVMCLFTYTSCVILPIPIWSCVFLPFYLWHVSFYLYESASSSLPKLILQ